MRLYLAHPTLERAWVRAAELEIEKRTGIVLLNPFYDGSFQEGKALDTGKVTPFDLNLSEELVPHDLQDIAESDGMLAIVTSCPMVGTFMEIFYNSYVLKRPTYIVIMAAHFYNHPWLRYMATERFKSLADFESWMIKQ